MNNTKTTDEDHKLNKHIIYEKHYESCKIKLSELTLKSDKVSFLRGITFAIAGLLLFFGYQQKKPALLIAALGFGFAFLMLIRYHGKLEEEQACLKDSQSVVKDYMARGRNALFK